MTATPVATEKREAPAIWDTLAILVVVVWILALMSMIADTALVLVMGWPSVFHDEL